MAREIPDARPGRSFPAPVTLALRLALALVMAGGAATGARAAGSVGSLPGDWMEMSPGSPPLNVILLSLDTTRQDRLSCYGFAKPTTPNLDKLAADGILFENAHTPVPVTLPAHTTMMTGQYPFEHGVRNNGSYIVPAKAVTLAELLKGKGYVTAAVMGAFPLDARFGLNQGFDVYDDRFSAESVFREGDTAQRRAPEVTRVALEWLDRPRTAPFFLWCHYFDAHAPYQPPEPFRSNFPGDLYAGEVASMDAGIGVLLDGLKSRGLLDRTVIIVAGDHGEGLGEHSEHTHSTFIYEQTQRVPFLLRLPDEGSFAGKGWHGARVPGLVDLTDILPTAWNILGQPRAELPSISGISLLPVVARKAPAHPWIYHETLVPEVEYGASSLRGLEDDTWKYTRAPRPELYNMKQDPQEKEDLATREPGTVQRMEARLDSILRAEGDPSAPRAMDAETLEKLKSLGYLGGATTPAGGSRPDPKDMRPVMKALSKAQTQAALYRTAEALRMIDSLLAANPKIPLAQRLRGTYLARLGRGEEAVKAYDQALADCNGCADGPRLEQERVSSLATAGKTTQALRDVQALLAKRPTEQGLNMILGEIKESQNDAEGARQAYAREGEVSPREPLPWVKVGNVEASRGRNAEAEKAYQKALTINPRNVEALVMLGELCDNTGRASEADALTDKAYAIDPEQPGAQVRKALQLQRKGQKDEALRLYQSVLKLQPDNAPTFFNLGTLYREMGRNADAEKAYRDAIATGKAPQGAYGNLGVLLAMKGNLKEAVSTWEEGLRREPNGKNAASIKQNLEKARSMNGPTEKSPAPGTPTSGKAPGKAPAKAPGK